MDEAEKADFQLLFVRYVFFTEANYSQCIRTEIPTSSCIDIPLTLSSTALRERENRRTGTLEKAHL